MPSFAGAVILPNLTKTLLFKNRDLPSENHKDDLFHDIDCFGVRGKDAFTGETIGIAIGVNHHGLAIANTHVHNTDNPSYHILTEQILMFAKDAKDGLSMVHEHLDSGRRYQWGNLVLADHDSMLVIEIAEGDHSIEWSGRKVLRTGHHIMLDTEPVLREESTSGGNDVYGDSVKRVERGYELLRQVENVEGVFGLLKDHGDQPGPASLCKHPGNGNQIATAMSYVIEVDHQIELGRPKIMFHVSKGNPCTSSFSSIPLVFPADEEVMKRVDTLYFA